MASHTISGDYRLPTPSECSTGNLMLALVAATPRFLRGEFLKRHRFYQAFDDSLREGQQGVSRKKWEVMQRGCGDLRGKNVLDIGCAEGFFCRQAALAGASAVVGVDSGLRTLLSARCLALQERLPITYRVGVFPTIGFDDTHDVVFCLSVLHHTVSTKDIWRVLSDERFAKDLETLRKHLAALSGITKPKGRCIIEMPYEYDDVREKAEVDFNRFVAELLAADFASARQIGSWEYRQDHEGKKDRILYVAEKR